MACSLSRPVLNTCFRIVESFPLFFLFLCILRYPFFSAVLSSVNQSRSVVKSRWCPQNRFKSGPSVNPSGKVLLCSHHPLSFSLVLCSDAKYETCLILSSAHSVRDASSSSSAHSVRCGEVLSLSLVLWKQCDFVSDTSGDLSPSCVFFLRKTFLLSVTRW